ncbi:hypothetical protein P0O24_11580 [Methanotrichaceae archaeon M04Ac]|uniref:Uncharacterized protein n=1 Tax=Candidatus Methanocrinis alkalitolerans TaxID=3033395 RepID=A0ABT5XHQ4_9EURY|nr:hypothetical protein [Candidatus Methanocrinis alkalitolerans]MCR3884433.1 hypothetical protein [Methanothrix sp.]MDF0594221.1 hypothetical protein [Candidatus Methanocrinis alkalitolerans]
MTRSGLKVTGRRGEEKRPPPGRHRALREGLPPPPRLPHRLDRDAGSGQRLFNRLSDTMVIVDDGSAPVGVRYVRDE